MNLSNCSAPDMPDWPVHPTSPRAPVDQTRISRAARDLAATTSRQVHRAESMRKVLSNALAIARERHRARPNRSTEILYRCRLVAWHERQSEPIKPRLTEAALDDRVNLIRSAYTQLWELGYKLPLVDGFGSRHAQRLLEHWKATLSRGGVEKRWAALRWWVDRALGKSGLVVPLEALWPPENPVAKPTVRQARTARAPQDAARVIAALMAIDERAGWMARLKAELGLTVVEASRVDPIVATSYEKVFMTCEERGRSGRAIVLDTEAKRVCRAELRAWGKRRARGTLAWPEMDRRQIVNRFDHLQRRARAMVAAQATEINACPANGQEAP